MQPVETTLDVSSAVTQFWNAHKEALFPQPVLVALTGLSAAYFERARWEGGGPRFLKFGRLVRYRKADVVDWINQRQPVASTSESVTRSARRAGREQARDDAKPEARTPVKQRKAQPNEPARTDLEPRAGVYPRSKTRKQATVDAGYP